MFDLDWWFGNLNLAITLMLDDVRPDRPEPNDDNGTKLEHEIRRFEDEGGPPLPAHQ